MNRNAPCPCGSGKRYKHCCGATVQAPVPTRSQALAAHRAGSLRLAETLYRRALEEDRNDVDVLHMLGVVQLERLRYREALVLLLDAAERTGWAVPQIRHNLGLALGKLLAREANRRQTDLVAEFLAWEQSQGRIQSDERPLVTVVLRTRNHAAFAARAIASVVAQTYRELELVVIDDGSTDGTADIVAACLEGAPIPARFVAGTNRGAPISYNEGALLARGKYVAFLDGEDCYAPERIAALVDGVARTGGSWGFSLVSLLPDDRELPEVADSAPAGGLWRLQSALLGSTTNSFALLQSNVVVSTGNLFVLREFFHSLGGFRDLLPHHEWDFGLRAAGAAEPRVVRRPLYLHRGPGARTGPESHEQPATEQDATLARFIATALSGTVPCTNPLAPQWPANRALMLARVLGAGLGTVVPVEALRNLAADLKMDPTAAPAPEPSAATAPGPRKTAVVVLGMHRSGTSALARVLNLCGAHLPPEVLPPSTIQNPAGYWESEAIVSLNDRVLRQLGGAWNRVDFALPDDAEFIAEFDHDARALLAAEYGTAATILIKDPRMCVLAPLWHRALVGAGYRPVYVVPVRDPLEVAQSLHARGDMTVPEGLALWLTYMRRASAFLDTVPEAMVVRFTDLLADWRGVVGRIAAGLDVALDVAGAADEVDRFLEPELRRQRAPEGALDALPGDAVADAVRALYRSLLDKGAQAARIAARPRALGERHAVLPDERHAALPDERHAVLPDERRDAPRATATFVLCIENNAIRDQALMLCESIRTFTGHYRNAPILALSPRPGLAVDRDTRRALADLDVEYVDVPLNTTCPDYGPANRVFAGAWAEARSGTDFMVVLDSDTVFLDEPEFPLDIDAAARPVDAKGSATRGPGDPFEEYWVALAAMCGTSVDRLPYIRATIDGERIRASYNAGLIVARRDKGIFTRGAELFSRSLEAGIRPYRGSGIDIYASTGSVGKAGSEFWGSSQAVLALAIWATTDRVLHYPACYNVPLHLVTSKGEIDPEWLARAPIHVHYHYMFARELQEVAMEVLAKLGVPAAKRDWLAQRIPYRSVPRATQTA